MFTSLINLFFPKTCAGCESMLLESEYVICTDCRHNLPFTLHHLSRENEAYKKFYGKIPIECGVTFLYYNKKGIVQDMIHKLKYKGQQDIGRALAHIFSKDFSNLHQHYNFDVIIPVPLHKKRLRERGYNQVSAFAAIISQCTKIPLDESLLWRPVYSKTQTKKNLLNRTVAGREIFAVNFNDSHHYKHFLLVDDVLTTGSTLEACSRELLKIPGAKISIACIAMSQS